MAFKEHPWAGFVAMALGVAMIIWILAEYYWFSEYSVLQPTMLGAGVLEFSFGFIIYLPTKKIVFLKTMSSYK